MSGSFPHPPLSCLKIFFRLPLFSGKRLISPRRAQGPISTQGLETLGGTGQQALARCPAPHLTPLHGLDFFPQKLRCLGWVESGNSSHQTPKLTADICAVNRIAENAIRVVNEQLVWVNKPGEVKKVMLSSRKHKWTLARWRAARFHTLPFRQVSRWLERTLLVLHGSPDSAGTPPAWPRFPPPGEGGARPPRTRHDPEPSAGPPFLLGLYLPCH